MLKCDQMLDVRVEWFPGDDDDPAGYVAFGVMDDDTLSFPMSYPGPFPTREEAEASAPFIRCQRGGVFYQAPIPERDDVEGAYSNALPAGYEPVEVIIRHPDFENDVYLYGMSHRVIELDLGSSFDVTKLGVKDRPMIEEWAEGVRNSIADLPEDHPARETVEETIADVLAEVE